MAPILDWKKLMKVDPDALPCQEELADRLLETMSKVDGKHLKTETPEQLIHLFKITQVLMKMKAQEVELALEEVEKAGEEQAKCENQFKTKVMKLQNELEMAQRSAGGRDTRFLRDEIHQLEKQLEQKERQLTDIEKELEKEKKVNEQLALRNEDAENENIRLRRENEQLRQDVVDYQRQIDSQKETILLRRGEDSDYRSQLSKKNFELVQYLDEIQNLTEANEKLDIQNEEMRKNLEESVQEMEKMTDEYNKMKLIVQQSDIFMDRLRKENEQYKFQVQELSDQLKAKNEEDDPLLAAVNAKVEEWKKILASKDDELLEYQQMLFNLKEKVKMAQLDVDRNSILALQQGVQERDAQIRLLTEQVEQYTKDMEQNAFVIEKLKNDLQNNKGHSSLAQQNRIGDMQEKLKMLEERTKEAEKSAELAEADAREKDKELAEALKRMRDYELGIYGLEEAIAEIKDLKKQIKIRDHEIETLIKEINELELKINYFLDENEELRARLGLEPKTMIDLDELRNSKALKQQQYRVENQILLQEIERLEEERIELKKQVRKLAQEKGRRVATIGLDAGDVQISDSFTEEKEINKRKLDFLNRHDIAEVKAKNEYLANELSVRERDLEKNRTVIAKFQSKWDDNAMDKAAKAITNSEILSISKKITTLEMKELNERQRAEHSQRMYEHLRNTVKQIEERNFELETKFAELTNINLEAQKVEQELRDELSKSVTKAVSDADRRQIMDLEKREMELKIEVSKLRELSDVAKMQVEALEARQQYRDKEVESLRMQILAYQAQSDEKAVIAKLHQHVIALQGSESAALGKLEALKLKLQKTEIQNLRLEQKLDEKEQALYYARLEGRNRAKHLQQTVQSLRRQFSGALPLAQQEKFSKTMIQLQNDKLKILEEVQHAQQERRNADNRALEMDLKLKSLEELISALKDTRGAQKVIEWHMKMEELHLQELKLNRELVKQKEEVKYLHNIISEYERTISNLEEEIVQQNKFHEERQMAWDQREVELQRQLDLYDHQQNEVLSTALKLEEATGSVPDPSLPLPQQLELALRKIREHIQTILETRATCKSLEEKLKEKETALWQAEQNVLSRDKVINELRLQLPATSEREKITAELGKQEDDPECHHGMKIAHQTIANMQARLNQKEEVLKKYQRLLAKAREEQEETAKKHEEDLRVLHQKLNLHTDNSLNKFKQTASELVKKTSLSLSNNKHFLRLAEMEQTVAEQDNSLASLVGKLKKTSSDLEKQKQITVMKIKEFETIRAQLQEKHTVDVEQLKDEANELRNVLSQMEKELANVKAELEVQKEANNRAPTATLKNLVEQLKSQLAIKEKQQKALSKALLELRAEMTDNAEQQIISAASQKEAYMNVQEIVDRQTKGLMAQIEELNNQITKLTDNLKISKARESSLSDEKDELNQELQRKQKAFAKMLREKNEMEKENEELKKRIRRLSSSIQFVIFQSKADEQNLIDALQKKIKKFELEKKCEETAKKDVREDKTSKEEIIRWEEGKKWQIRMEGLRNKLRQKGKEADALAKQLNTLKEMYTKTEKEKIALQKKLKTTGVTVDRVVGVRASETEKELEELRKRNIDLENEVAHMRTQQAIPRDSVVEELHFKNQYLQEKLHALQRQCSTERCSRPLSTCDQTELTKSVPISISKQKYLNFLQKKSVSNRDEIKHQTNHSITDGNEIDEEADMQTCIVHNEGHEATADTSTEASPEQHPEDSEKRKDTDVSREGLKNKNIAEADEENCSEKEENITQPENGSFNEEFEEEERKQEIVKQSNVDEESVEEPYTDRMSCNQSDSGEPSNQANDYEAGKIDVNNEMNQHTAEDKHETYRSGTEGVETTPEFCEMPETSGIRSDDQYRREQEVLKENLRLSSENVELRFQLEQANKDLPRLKDRVDDLKEMCELLKKEKADVEQKLSSIRGVGRSGKTVPELEKTIGLMKKVVERVQRENEDLKKAPAVVSNEKLLGLEQENERLKSEMEKMKLHLGGQLSMRYESKTKGMEKVITENERLRKELKKEADSGEKLRIAKNNLEILNEKLTVQLEETVKRLNLAESQFDGADSKSWKSVVTRMHETKMKKMEMDISKKTQSITDLKRLLQEATEREHNADKNLQDLKEQIELLKHFPEGARTEQSLIRELQLLRLTNNRLEKEKAELAHQVEDYKHHILTCTSEDPAAGHNEIVEKDKNDKLMTEVADLQIQLKDSELEKQQLQEETKKLRRELENFHPSFFEEIEDLKYNYNEEVKKNIILEERLKQLSEEFGIQVDSSGNVSVD
ncbi:centrosomal protein of 290 kDa isoform X11 [Pelecanus crispus]|uniref:centrosomal protein of 290 kDa isoform X11 n=1 Tax=Pelecanus crispus TaxID=36300 RepID=UPI003F5D00AB